MKVLVTGGGGFLGQAICRQLLARGFEVRSLSRSDYPELRELGVDHIQGDIVSESAVADATQGCDAIIHTAALAGIWGDYQRYYDINVVGTENVIKACHKHSLSKLVYTSSPSVVSNGEDLEGVDESQPYGEDFEAHYPATKALAEQKVVAASDEQLATVSLRPHLIWGPGDHHILPRLIDRAKKGKLRRIGSDNKLVDTIYVDNAAEAHLLALDKLEPGSDISGKVYFLSQDEPIPCWDMINKFLEAADAPLVTRKVPYFLAYGAASVAESYYRWRGLKDEPPMTRFVVHQFSTAHWFDISAAKKDLGYKPTVSIEEGLKRLKESFKN